jgi:hypothetical protein
LEYWDRATAPLLGNKRVFGLLERFVELIGGNTGLSLSRVSV